MKTSDYLKMAIEGLRTNKVRSILTILGIVIGISAVVTMMSLGNGAQQLIVSQIQGLGSNLIVVMPGGIEEEQGKPPRITMEGISTQTLTLEDSQAILKKSNVFYAKNVAPLVIGGGKITYKNESRSTNYIGTVPSIQEINNNYPSEGRFFTEDEVKSMAKVVVLGATVKNELFRDEDPLDKIIKIDRINFKVIGVMEEKGARGMEDPDDQVFIPITTAQKQLRGIDYVNAILVQAENENVIEQTVADIEQTLKERHNIGDASKNDFTVRSQKEFVQVLGMVTGIFTIFLSVISGIALVVGGIGIMNIMLVSVTERTREIGLRKAIGARKKDILNQFLLEALTLTILGGIIGIILGFIGSYLGSIILGKILNAYWEFTISPGAIILAFGVATVIGLGFGIYPAKKASELSPIEALRYE